MVMSAAFTAATLPATLVMVLATTFFMVVMVVAAFSVMMPAAFPVVPAAILLMFMVLTALMRMRCISHYPFLLFI